MVNFEIFKFIMMLSRLPLRYQYLDLPKHVMRNVSRFCLHAQLLWWNPSSGAAEMVTATSALVLLSKMRCTFYFTVKTCLCALSERSICSISPFCQSFSVEAPYILHALPSQTVFDFLSQWHKKLCHNDYISDITDYFLAGKDQQQTNRPVMLRESCKLNRLVV